MVTYTNRSTRFPHENLFVPCCLTTNYPCLRTNQCHQLCKKGHHIYIIPNLLPSSTSGDPFFGCKAQL